MALLSGALGAGGIDELAPKVGIHRGGLTAAVAAMRKGGGGR